MAFNSIIQNPPNFNFDNNNTITNTTTATTAAAAATTTTTAATTTTNTTTTPTSSSSTLPHQVADKVVETIKNKNQLKEIAKLISDKGKLEECILNHYIMDVQQTENNIILESFQKIYRDYINIETDNKDTRIFRHFCPVCVYLKLGFFSDNIIKNLHSISCRNSNNNNLSKSYNLGTFIKVINPYKSNRNLPVQNILMPNHPSDKIAFPSGTLLIPTGKLFIQLLALPQEFLVQGLKIIQIMSDEKDIDNPRIYYRFLARNSDLTNGYYKRDQNNLNKLNKMNTGEENDTFITAENRAKIHDIFKDYLKNVPTPSSPSTSKATYPFNIPDVDDNFDENNVFQNGEPLVYVNKNMSCSNNEIKMKVFDLNPILINYLQSIINIQKHIEKSKKKINKNDDTNYFNHWTPIEPILNTVFYDLLMLGFYSEMDLDTLTQIPPFNEKCVLMQQNILILNKNGDCIMTQSSDENAKDNDICSVFNKVLKKSSSSLLPIIPTAFPLNINAKGIPPKSKINVPQVINIINTTTTNNNDNLSDADKVKMKYRDIWNHHKQKSNKYHSIIKQNCDSLKNYFCVFQDDMNEDVKNTNNIIYDIASRMFPQRILHTIQNKSMHSLDFSQKAVTKPIIDEESHPNCSYCSNLGFINIMPLCDNTPLVLKNTSVYLENLVNRDKEGYINKTSENCNYDEDDDDEDGNGGYINRVNLMVQNLPTKRKMDMNNVIDLVGDNLNDTYDYNAHTKMTKCVNPPSFTHYSTRYNDTNSLQQQQLQSQNCLRTA